MLVVRHGRRVIHLARKLGRGQGMVPTNQKVIDKIGSHRSCVGTLQLINGIQYFRMARRAIVLLQHVVQVLLGSLQSVHWIAICVGFY